MIIRRLIVPLTVAVVTAHAGQGFAQGAFPAPLPGQAAAEQRSGVSAGERRRARPLPSARAPSSFPVTGAAPVTGSRVRARARRRRRRRAAAGRLHEGIHAAARRGREARQADQGRQRPPCAAGGSLQADREFRPGRNQDDQICRDQRREMRDSAAGRRPAEDRPQEHRDHAEEGLRGGAAGSSKEDRPARA